MATVSFQILSDTENAPIYLRISIKRGLAPRTNTGLYINPKNWSSTTKLPKQTSSFNKNLTTDLLGLKTHITQKYNEASKNGLDIDKDWLKHNIDVFFNRINEDAQSELLIDAAQSIIDDVDTRKNAKGGIGLSKSRKNAYISLQNMLIDFQKHKKKQYKVRDVNVKFAKEFLQYLLQIQGYQKSYAVKKIADLKTVCNDAELNGIETNVQLKKIASAKTKNDNILYLNPKELEKIEEVELPTEALKNARKWLLLGCNIGQRGGDLLELNENNLINRNGYDVIELKQKKTDKAVTIPVLDTTKVIIKSGLPYKISIQKFNNHIKDVCQIAGIDNMIKGKLFDADTMRKKEGVYHKWQLMSSHVCRRSFATNLYGILPTPLIMQITAHSSEKMLLNYIGKNGYDYAQHIADFYELQKQRNKKEPQLSIVKNSVNN